MSSKVIRDGKVQAQPLAWRPAGIVPSTGGNASEGAPAGDAMPVMPSRGAADVRIRELEAELEQKTKEAFRAGAQQGEAAARQRAQAELDKQMTALARTSSELAGLRPRIRKETERELVELALGIARRILRRELTIDPEALSGVVKAAISKIDLRETHRLRTHPSHSAALARRLADMGAPAQLQVVADAGLELGAVVFETTHGVLDASVETQLAEIQHGFADMMGAAEN